MDEREQSALTIGTEDHWVPLAGLVGPNLGAQTTIALPVADGLVILPVQHLVRLEADGGYTYVHKVQGRKQLVSRRLGDLQRLLPASGFFRCHHGHVINLAFVAKLIRAGGHRILLTTGESVMVARRRWKELLSALGHPR
jgi:two-component system LytT family response regulator